jgi:reactive intermediate/imine deaminase
MSSHSIIRIPHGLPIPLSRAVIAGGFAFLSGQRAIDEAGRIVGEDVRTQTRVVLEKIAESLAVCGLGMNDVVRTTVWLSDLQDFAEFNDEYRRHFIGGYPSRSTVEARLYAGAKIEIEVQACLRN